MPIYEYECQACAHRFEEWQKMSDKPVKVCPRCKARKVEKLISHTSFQLKGGGWYSDLYASAKPSSSPSGAEAGAGTASGKEKSGKEKSKEKSPSGGDAATASAKTTETKTKASAGGARVAA